MANNRMWLKNKRTGAQVLIAKYYPSCGWGVFHGDLGDRIGTILSVNEPPPTRMGDNDWVIEYEETA